MVSVAVTPEGRRGGISINSIRILVVAVGVTLLVLAGCSRGPSGATGTSNTVVDEPWLYGGEDVRIPVIDTLGRDLGKASRALKNKQPAEASAALRDGAAFLEHEAEGVTPEGRAKMKAAAAKLNKLADRIDGGASVSAESFQAEMREAHAVDVDYLWATAAAEEWMPRVGQVEEHLQGARQQLAANQPQELATELRKTAALLRLEAGRLGGTAKKSIEVSWFEVRQLGAKAQIGALTDAVRLEQVAARTNQTLARAYTEEAKRLWDERQAEQTAQLLGVAVEEYERGLAWIGAENEEQAKADAENARRLARVMAAGPTPATKKVAEVFEKFDIAVNALGKRLD